MSSRFCVTDRLWKIATRIIHILPRPHMRENKWFVINTHTQNPPPGGALGTKKSTWISYSHRTEKSISLFLLTFF